MIALEGLAARRAPFALSSLTASWGPGVHAVVGAGADGPPLLLALVAGAARPRAGRVRVLDATPSDASVRRRIGFVPLETSLPEALRVREIFSVAAAIRGEPPRSAEERLAALGVEALAQRDAAGLSRDEARAVALAEAATSSIVRVLLVEEPLVAIDPRAAARVPEVLRARAAEGWSILVATASVRDACELADDHVLLEGGAIVGRASSSAELGGLSRRGVRIRIVTSDPRPLAVALAREEAVDAVSRRDSTIVARGSDPTELARAAGRAIMAAGVDVVEMRAEPPSLDEARAAAAGRRGGAA